MFFKDKRTRKNILFAKKKFYIHIFSYLTRTNEQKTPQEVKKKMTLQAYSITRKEQIWNWLMTKYSCYWWGWSNLMKSRYAARSQLKAASSSWCSSWNQSHSCCVLSHSWQSAAFTLSSCEQWIITSKMSDELETTEDNKDEEVLGRDEGACDDKEIGMSGSSMTSKDWAGKEGKEVVGWGVGWDWSREWGL